jgi:GDP-L-fucose synthase
MDPILFSDIVLITQYFKVKNDDPKYTIDRQKEIDYCLIKNCENKYIDKIHLFIEENANIDFINKYKTKIVVIHINKRITFKDVFQYYNDNLSESICILLNSDIYLDDSIQIVKHVNFNKLFISLNRYEINNDKCNLLNGLEINEAVRKNCSTYLKPYQPSIWSQDGWIWKHKHLNFDIKYDFLLGSTGCDNYISYLLNEDNYIVCNPSSLICLNHFDVLSIETDKHGISKGNISNKREKRVGNMNQYLFLENIDDIPDKYTISCIKEPAKFKFICNYKFIKNISKININTSQIIASSYLNDNHKPHNCLFEENGYWQPAENDATPYIQFNFENIYEIAVIDIKGKNVDKDDTTVGFIKKFKISYVNNFISNKWILDETIYDAINSLNGNFIKRIYLEQNIICFKIRIYPLEYYNINTFKVSFYKLNCNKYNILDDFNDIYIDKTKFTTTFFDYKYIEDLHTKHSCLQKYQPTKYDKNILNEQIQDGICMIVCVMNRTTNILQNISSWLNQKINQLIILDWSSKCNFNNDITKLNDPRILYVYVNNEDKYIRTYAQNLAASLCKYNKICKIDSDILLSDNFFENHTLNTGEFYVGDFNCARNDNEKSTHGNTYLYISDYFKINGYNEYIKTYGWDDSDFTIRLLMTGLEKKIFNQDLFYHVPHDDNLRIANNIKDHPYISIYTHKFYLEYIDLWSNKFNSQKYQISPQNPNYIICNREKNSEYTFDEYLYNKSKNQAIKLVFNWYKTGSQLHTDYYNNNDYDNMFKHIQSKIVQNKQSILVTGGSGLVGNAIKQIASQYDNFEFIFISSKDFDLCKMKDTIQMFTKYKPNIVIHLAACVGGLYKNMNNKVEMLEKNLLINYNVVKCAHDFKVGKLIACLSTCIFPDKVVYPINETMLHDGAPHESNYTYAYAKRMLEIQCRAYRENYEDNFICVIPTNIYGPHDNFDLDNGHVLPALIHKCYLAKQQNIDFVVKGTGSPLRQFIYSEDLARLIMWSLENYNDIEPLILSVPEKDEISIKDIAIIIAKNYGYEKRLVFDPTFSDGQFKKTVSNNKLTNLLSSNKFSFNFIKIEDGIKSACNWFNQSKK